ncbi:NAD(P)-dependent oxidoreductase [Nocardiopsis sediminis]|uniref:NAD(P)-dependent oxidoreductase n=1 Tax=Nocardiopsis sediminis TaxID=1778267 RepID=A0ABV8FLJ9_9ACTN
MGGTLVVFGASGGTGRALVDQALARGQDVTAVVRDPARLEVDHERLTVVTADVADPGEVADAIRGARVVASALGGASRATPAVCAPAVANMIKAMRGGAARRLLVVSAAPVQHGGAGERLLYRATVKQVLRAVLRRNYADLAAMEHEVRASGLDWTIFRPPQLTDGPATGHYRTAADANVPGGYVISRADLAAEMLRAAESPTTMGRTIGIGY